MIGAEELRLLADSAAGWLDRHHGFAQRAQLLRTHGGRASPLWRDFAAMGWLGLGLPERLGGLGGGAMELAPLMRAFGRALVVEPFLPTILMGAALLAAIGDPAHEAAASEAAEGRRQIALAVDAGDGRATRSDSGGWRVAGRWRCVPGGDAADLLLVVARDASGEGLSIFAIPAATQGLVARGYRCQDGHRAADLRLDGCELPPSALVGAAGGAEAALRPVREVAIAALLQEAVGAMDAAIAHCIRHLQSRRQFGRPLAEFQVLRHRLVDMWIAAEEARSMADYAAEATLWTDGPARAGAIAAAKARVAQTDRFVGQQAIQLHGAIGLADEHPIGHYAKRLEAIGTLFGDADHHLGLLAG